jgi:hypothetical protein
MSSGLHLLAIEFLHLRERGCLVESELVGRIRAVMARADQQRTATVNSLRAELREVEGRWRRRRR